MLITWAGGQNRLTTVREEGRGVRADDDATDAKQSRESQLKHAQKATTRLRLI